MTQPDSSMGASQIPQQRTADNVPTSLPITMNAMPNSGPAMPIAGVTNKGFRITSTESKALKAVVGFIGIALTLASALALPEPWNTIVGLLLGAGTSAGIWAAPNKVTSATIKGPTSIIRAVADK